jgi:hypothetical protein
MTELIAKTMLNPFFFPKLRSFPLPCCWQFLKTLQIYREIAIQGPCNPQVFVILVLPGYFEMIMNEYCLWLARE